MAEGVSSVFLLSPTSEKHKKTTSFPRLFTGLTSLKSFSEAETCSVMMSPTSILDTTKPFSVLKNPFWSDSSSSPLTPKTPEPETRHRLDTKGVGVGVGVGLAMVDKLNHDQSDLNESKPETRTGNVLFGSQLKIQIPPLLSSPPLDTPKSPCEFGIKTRNSFSPPEKKSAFGSPNETPNSPHSLTATEMELSEEYTRVITHGPNPRTTHIFDDCIVESCCGVVGFSALKKETTVNDDRLNYPSENFLSFCYSCKKNLGQGKDIYMYRGEKAFCSSECRYEEMLLEESLEKLGS